MFRKRPKIQETPEWLIIGLGNPGAEYSGTRHNVGFEVLDLFAKKHKIKLDVSRHQARYGQGRVFGTPIALVKPLTFMNRSGQAVALLQRQFGVPLDQILVIADDTDLPLGRVRIRLGGSAGGHNGHKSLIEKLGSSEYPRLKLGVGRVDKDETIDHVLGTFAPDERDSATTMIEMSVRAIELILEGGVTSAMNEIHPRS